MAAGDRKERLTLDVSQKAKDNLRALAERDDRSQGAMLDKLLTDYFPLIERAVSAPPVDAVQP